MRRHLGKLAALWRYPVKSMAAEPIERSAVGWFGLAGDRRWALVRDDQQKSDFPWLTIRERSELTRYRPRLDDPSNPDKSMATVVTPAGQEIGILDPALTDELGGGTRVIKLQRGAFDTFPISIVSTQTVARLGELVGRPLDVGRFRPNLLVDAEGDDPFPEDAWVGHTIRVGAVRLRVDARDQRCVVVNVDPDTADRAAEILKTIARERDARLGVYATVVTPGELAVGDAVTAEELHPAAF